jgi:hypothetical protein
MITQYSTQHVFTFAELEAVGAPSSTSVIYGSSLEIDLHPQGIARVDAVDTDALTARDRIIGTNGGGLLLEPLCLLFQT